VVNANICENATIQQFWSWHWTITRSSFLIWSPLNPRDNNGGATTMKYSAQQGLLRTLLSSVARVKRRLSSRACHLRLRHEANEPIVRCNAWSTNQTPWRSHDAPGWRVLESRICNLVLMGMIFKRKMSSMLVWEPVSSTYGANRITNLLTLPIW